MKILDLLEMPYEISGSMPKNSDEQETDTKLTTISDFTLNRGYTKIGSFLPAISGRGLVSFHMENTDHFVIGTVKVLVRINRSKTEVRNKSIFNLSFKASTTLECDIPDFKNRKILQVNRVRTAAENQGLGIAVAAYVNLAKSGFVVLSDSTQFTDGKMLWKSIINIAELKHYKIAIINVETGIIGSYDDIDESKIWTTEQDYSGERILLALYT